MGLLLESQSLKTKTALRGEADVVVVLDVVELVVVVIVLVIGRIGCYKFSSTFRRNCIVDLQMVPGNITDLIETTNSLSTV